MSNEDHLEGDVEASNTPTDEFQPQVDAPSGAASIFGPFFNAILSPGELWAAIDAKPSLSAWVVLWTLVVSTGLSIYNMPITQSIMVQSTRASMRAQNPDISPEQLQQMTDSMMTFGTVLGYASSVFILVGIGFVGLLIWILGAVMGGRGASFGRAFGVAAGAAVIHPMVYSIYATIILNMNPPEIRRAADASTVAPTLGLDLILAGPNTPAWLEVIMQRVDLFNLWWAVLVVGGCMIVLKLKKGQAITTAAVIWLLFTAFAVLGALAQGLGAS